MIASGGLDERVDILAPSVTRSGSGSQVITYGSIGTRFASVRYLKGARALTSGEMLMTGTISVTMRPMVGLADDCRVVWDGKTYRITSLNRSRGEVSLVAEVIDINQE